MMRKAHALAVLFLSSLTAWSQTPPKGQEDVLERLIALSEVPLLPQAPAATPSAQPTPDEDPGQRVFEQNCSRCHNAPEGFSPSITGTIVRHMRVRASLSHEEEQELLHFFNP